MYHLPFLLVSVCWFRLTVYHCWLGFCRHSSCSVSVVVKLQCFWCSKVNSLDISSLDWFLRWARSEVSALICFFQVDYVLILVHSMSCTMMGSHSFSPVIVRTFSSDSLLSLFDSTSQFSNISTSFPRGSNLFSLQEFQHHHFKTHF